MSNHDEPRIGSEKCDVTRNGWESINLPKRPLDRSDVTKLKNLGEQFLEIVDSVPQLTEMERQFIDDEIIGYPRILSSSRLLKIVDPLPECLRPRALRDLPMMSKEEFDAEQEKMRVENDREGLRRYMENKTIHAPSHWTDPRVNPLEELLTCVGKAREADAEILIFETACEIRKCIMPKDWRECPTDVETDITQAIRRFRKASDPTEMLAAWAGIVNLNNKLNPPQSK